MKLHWIEAEKFGEMGAVWEGLMRREGAVSQKQKILDFLSSVSSGVSHVQYQYLTDMQVIVDTIQVIITFSVFGVRSSSPDIFHI